MITIFTAVYNRANLIRRLYKSLVNQTNYNFEWVVIDDGSTDNIENVMNSFIEEDILPNIRFVRREHGGKHRAINIIDNIANGEAIVFVDSDDMLLPNAVERFTELWNEIKDSQDIVASATMMKSIDGKISGSRTSINQPLCILWVDKNKYGLDGEYAYVFKRGIWEKYSLPEYEGEFFVSEAISMINMSKDDLKIQFNDDVLYQYEYQNEGLSRNLDLYYKENPKGYANLCFAWTNKDRDYCGFLEACTNFYEICYQSFEDETIDKILNITIEEKRIIKKQIDECLYKLQAINGQIGIYGYGYLGHKIRRYLELLRKKYILIDKNANHIKTDKVVTLEDDLSEISTIIICIRNEEVQFLVKEEIKSILPEVNIKVINDYYVDYV